MKAEMQKVIDEKEEYLEFYRPFPRKLWDAQKELAEANNKLERIRRILNSDGIKQIAM